MPPASEARKTLSVTSAALVLAVSVLACLACGAVATLEWLHIGYRLYLIAEQSHFALRDNHMAKQTFEQCYTYALLGGSVSGLGFLLGKNLPRSLRRSMLLVAMLCLLSAGTLFLLHETGVLVEYGEAHNV